MQARGPLRTVPCRGAAGAIARRLPLRPRAAWAPGAPPHRAAGTEGGGNWGEYTPRQAGKRGRGGKTVPPRRRPVRNAGTRSASAVYSSLLSEMKKTVDKGGRAAVRNAERVLANMYDRNLRDIDHRPYTLLLKARLRVQGEDAIGPLLERMRAHDVALAEPVFNTIVHHHAQNGEFGAAARAIARMAREGLAPDEVTHRTMISAHARRDEEDEAWDWLARLRGDGLPIGDATACTLLLLPSLEGKPAAVDAALARLHAQGAALGTMTYTRALQLLAAGAGAADPADAAAATDAAWAMWRDMLDSDLAASFHPYNVMLRLCATAGDTAAADRVWREMLTRDVPRNPVTYDERARVYEAVGDEGGLRQVLRDARADGSRLRAFHYNTLARLFHARGGAAAGTRLLRLLDEVIESDMKPTAQQYRLTVEALGRERRLRDLVNVLDEVGNTGLRRDGSIASAGVCALVDEGSPAATRALLALADAVGAEGIPLDEEASAALQRVPEAEARMREAAAESQEARARAGAGAGAPAPEGGRSAADGEERGHAVGSGDEWVPRGNRRRRRVADALGRQTPTGDGGGGRQQ